MKERSELRTTVSLVARYGVVTGTTLFEGVGTNLSPTGMFIGTRRPLNTGAKVRIDCEPYDREGHIRGTAKVIWTRRSGEGGNRPAGMGLEFVELEQEARALIDQMLRVGDASSAGPGARSEPPEAPEPPEAEAEPVLEEPPERKSAAPQQSVPPPRPSAPSGIPSAPHGLRASRLEALIESADDEVVEASPAPDRTQQKDRQRPQKRWLSWLGGIAVIAAAATTGWIALRAPTQQAEAPDPEVGAATDVAADGLVGQHAPGRDTTLTRTLAPTGTDRLAASPVRQGPAATPATLSTRDALPPAPAGSLSGDRPAGVVEDAQQGKAGRTQRNANHKTHRSERRTAARIPAAGAAAPPADDAAPTPGAYEAAIECVKHGDNACALAALKGKAHSERELALLVETYRAMGRKADRDAAMRDYLARFPDGSEAARYSHALQQTTSAPDATPPGN